MKRQTTLFSNSFCFKKCLISTEEIMEKLSFFFDFYEAVKPMKQPVIENYIKRASSEILACTDPKDSDVVVYNQVVDRLPSYRSQILHIAVSFLEIIETENHSANTQKTKFFREYSQLSEQSTNQEQRDEAYEKVKSSYMINNLATTFLSCEKKMFKVMDCLMIGKVSYDVTLINVPGINCNRNGICNEEGKIQHIFNKFYGDLSKVNCIYFLEWETFEQVIQAVFYDLEVTKIDQEIHREKINKSIDLMEDFVEKMKTYHKDLDSIYSKITKEDFVKKITALIKICFRKTKIISYKFQLILTELLKILLVEALLMDNFQLRSQSPLKTIEGIALDYLFKHKSGLGSMSKQYDLFRFLIGIFYINNVSYREFVNFYLLQTHEVGISHHKYKSFVKRRIGSFSNFSEETKANLNSNSKWSTLSSSYFYNCTVFTFLVPILIQNETEANIEEEKVRIFNQFCKEIENFKIHEKINYFEYIQLFNLINDFFEALPNFPGLTLTIILEVLKIEASLTYSSKILSVDSHLTELLFILDRLLRKITGSIMHFKDQFNEILETSTRNPKFTCNLIALLIRATNAYDFVDVSQIYLLISKVFVLHNANLKVINEQIIYSDLLRMLTTIIEVDGYLSVSNLILFYFYHCLDVNVAHLEDAVKFLIDKNFFRLAFHWNNKVREIFFVFVLVGLKKIVNESKQMQTTSTFCNGNFSLNENRITFIPEQSRQEIMRMVYSKLIVMEKLKKAYKKGVMTQDFVRDFEMAKQEISFVYIEK